MGFEDERMDCKAISNVNIKNKWKTDGDEVEIESVLFVGIAFEFCILEDK